VVEEVEVIATVLAVDREGAHDAVEAMQRGAVAHVDVVLAGTGVDGHADTGRNAGDVEGVPGTAAVQHQGGQSRALLLHDQSAWGQAGDRGGAARVGDRHDPGTGVAGVVRRHGHRTAATDDGDLPLDVHQLAARRGGLTADGDRVACSPHVAREGEVGDR